jgi:hypothetical protein
MGLSLGQWGDRLVGVGAWFHAGFWLGLCDGWGVEGGQCGRVGRLRGELLALWDWCGTWWLWGSVVGTVPCEVRSVAVAEVGWPSEGPRCARPAGHGPALPGGSRDRGWVAWSWVGCVIAEATRGYGWVALSRGQRAVTGGSRDRGGTRGLRVRRGVVGGSRDFGRVARLGVRRAITGWGRGEDRALGGAAPAGDEWVARWRRAGRVGQLAGPFDLGRLI